MNYFKATIVLFAVIAINAVNAQCGCSAQAPAPVVLSPIQLPAPPAPCPYSAPIPAPLPPAPCPYSAPAPPAPCPYSAPAPPAPCPYSAPIPPYSAPIPAPVPVAPAPAPYSYAPAPAPAPLPPKPKVFIHKQPPIVINRPAKSFNVAAGQPVIIKPAAVVIQRPGTSEVQPYSITVTSPPIVVNKKIIKIERPILKKYYVEQYSRTEPCGCNDQLVGSAVPQVNPCPAPPAPPAPCPYTNIIAPAPAPLPCGCK